MRTVRRREGKIKKVGTERVERERVDCRLCQC